ncbi:MAG: calcium-binding protein [Nitrosomonas sp.]|nr:MAG: calcium-binding protein [Nitrosomonas sp.]
MGTIYGTNYNDNGTWQFISSTWRWFGVLNGSAESDTIYGYIGDDKLYGYENIDNLYGHSGNDLLEGGDGNDKLDGGTGADIMRGGWGSDTYHVDSMSDSVIEFFSNSLAETNDLVISSVSTSYKWLPSNVEYLMLQGSAYFGDGNDLNNIITGSDSANALYGYGGGDWIAGLAGNDSLIGGIGADTLIGGTGADKFILGHRSTADADTIQDFNHQDDTIVLVNSLDIGILDGAINPGIKGLTFTGGNFSNNQLSVGRYFEGPGLTGNNNSNQSSGIYVNTTNGEIWYNPTNNNLGDVYEHLDSEIIGRVSASVAASMDYTDFVYGI